MSYSKVDRSFWCDSKVESWNSDVKLFALYLLTNHHSNSEGFYKLPLAYMSFVLKLEKENIRELLTQLIKDNFIAYDEQNSIILINKNLKYNNIKNKNQRIAAYKRIENLTHSYLFQKFIKIAETYDKKFASFIKKKM